MRFDTYKMPNGAITVRPAGNTTSKLEDMLREMEQTTTLTKADGIAAVTFIRDYLVRELSFGTTVSIEGLGMFGVSLTLDEQKDESKVTGNDVRMKRVTFKAAPALKKSITDRIRKERVCVANRNVSRPRYTIAERREIARRFVKCGDVFTADDYRQCTQTSLTTAISDLRRFAAEGMLTLKDSGHIIKCRKPDNA